MKQRFTLNAGVRFEKYIGRSTRSTPTPASSSAIANVKQITNVPNWTTVVPRLAVVYDLTGQGKTAIRPTPARYV